MLNFPWLEDAQPARPPALLLETPARLGVLDLKNRVVMAAMTTGFASPAGRPTDRLLAWYGARASGGPAAAIVEETLVLDDARCRGVRPRKLRLADDRAIPAFRRLADTIRAGGAVPILQLAYPGVRDVSALSRDELEQIGDAFVAAAHRAQRAGFAAVQVQATPTRLLGQLLSPLTNRRRDRYGRAAGRTRLLLAIIGGAKQRLGASYPVLVKLTGDERRPDGLTPDIVADITRALVAHGADGIEVVGGAGPRSVPPTELLSSGVGEATRADLAATVKAAVAGTPALILTNGRILSSEGAEGLLRAGQADLVSMGRALLADPGWLAKHLAGIELETIPCISCMACFTPAPDGGIGCPVNGDAGREHLPPLPGVERPRRIAIAGASLAAMELARVAAARGHQVEITTAGLPLGGLFGLRAGVPGDAEFGRAFLYLGDRLNELGVPMVDELATDRNVFVDCRPTPERRPAWANGRGVLLAGDILGRDLHEMYGVGRRVVVVGDGALAAEVALFLAGWGRRPVVVVPGGADNPFPDVHPNHAARLLERLEGYKATVVSGATVRAWRYDDERRSQLLVERDGREETLAPFHTAISAAGWEPLTPWPQHRRLPQRPGLIADGTTIHMGDTIYPEPLRDMVAYANLLGRVI